MSNYNFIYKRLSALENTLKRQIISALNVNAALTSEEYLDIFHNFVLGINTVSFFGQALISIEEVTLSFRTKSWDTQTRLEFEWSFYFEDFDDDTHMLRLELEFDLSVVNHENSESVSKFYSCSLNTVFEDNLQLLVEKIKDDSNYQSNRLLQPNSIAIYNYCDT